MQHQQTTTRGRGSPAWSSHVADLRHPLLMRVVAYAETYADEHGHALLSAGQLRRAVDPSDTTSAAMLSKAIRAAVRDGWLHDLSTARCLVLARGLVVAPCPALHRGEGCAR